MGHLSITSYETVNYLFTSSGRGDTLLQGGKCKATFNQLLATIAEKTSPQPCWQQMIENYTALAC